MTMSEIFESHIALLTKMSDEGDEVAARSIACIALVCEGWRYGEPHPDDDPDGGPDDDGGEPMPCNVIPFRRAA